MTNPTLQEKLREIIDLHHCSVCNGDLHEWIDAKPKILSDKEAIADILVLFKEYKEADGESTDET